MPDVAIAKDLLNVRLELKGKHHVYKYGNRFENMFKEPDAFGAGVKFGEKYGSMSYSRPVYRADYEYENSEDRSQELQVYLTYQIALNNQSANLKAKINQIVDYFDSRYELVDVGLSADENEGTIGDSIRNGKTATRQYGNDGKYTQLLINTDTELDSLESKNIYVQFRLNRLAVKSIIESFDNNDVDGTLKNVTEITSYSTFDKNGKVYAGIDVDSNPGSAVPGNKDTYEDDTDEAPSIKLEVQGEREITGKVFEDKATLDSPTDKAVSGEIREGNGAYDDGEEGVKNVEAKLLEKGTNNVAQVYNSSTNSWEDAVLTTDDTGDYTISGLLPGEYEISYTWGDEDHPVENTKQL